MRKAIARISFSLLSLALLLPIIIVSRSGIPLPTIPKGFF